MLDTDTKRRIDSCRDILVGKVPDPKSQVEQITIALIYKFMDDMDAEAEELGGARSFFANGYAKYGWARLMAPSLGGHDVLNLYSEAIGKMTENPGIPPLFRDIFKNAYLPYRDPETLRIFLKEIDGFSYDHSERLGDAFEYLLSVLGSQGDAGQFRTPRHIIDFMVEVIDPKKSETILDPACGTAGFLISAWKHILKQNTKERAGDQLTPDERQHLATNILGYDISPDMVRLSLVNMYLHGFTNPHIAEYDTLTSEDKWNEMADVILANPPFMSPKGGIKPHKRFSIQAKRSEVLFVDYMAEHLTSTGRAGIIVPEGIIFQSQTAYKDLRKMLVANSLVAVVSLPAGCFNPYSGVKTSILILDKALARRSDTIAFFKVENDGFGLGAQRRAFDKNDLPQVKAELADYLQALRNHQPTADLQPTSGLIVAKEKIAANGDYNLSGERYREGAVATSSYPFVPLSEVARVKNGFAFKSEEYVDKGLRVMRIKNVQKGEVIDDDPKFMALERRTEFADYTLKAGDILMSLTGNVGRVGRLKQEHEPAVLNQRVAHVEPNSGVPCLSEYLFALLNTDRFEAEAIAGSSGVAQANLSSKWVGDYQIPLPPLEVQKEIVAEIEGYQKVINGARAVLDHYRPHIPIHPDWPMVELREIIDELESGVSVNSTSTPTNEDEFGILKTSCVTTGIFQPEEHKTVVSDELTRVRCPVRGNTIIISRMNTEALVGANAYVDKDYPHLFLPDRLWQTVITRHDVEVRYIQTVLASDSCRSRISAICGGTSGSMKNIAKPQLLSITVPLPPLHTQQAIVAEIEAEQALVAANRELIARFEKKIQATLARVWGENAAEPFGENA
jgi:type I restriction enzyme M protein